MISISREEFINTCISINDKLNDYLYSENHSLTEEEKDIIDDDINKIIEQFTSTTSKFIEVKSEVEVRIVEKIYDLCDSIFSRQNCIRNLKLELETRNSTYKISDLKIIININKRELEGLYETYFNLSSYAISCFSQTRKR